MYRSTPDRTFRDYPEYDDRPELKDSATKYEQERIHVLQQERVGVQKKTFTKWCNSYLEKVHMIVNDLFADLGDGKLLMKLLEIISGENLGRPNRGVLRVQKMENVSRCLTFLATKVTFENIGAEDIVDGNPRLILGLIWTIILRFQIQDIVIEVNEHESSETRSAKDALLLWCQKKTEGYRGVKIDNFSTSWRNGLGFNALIHAHRPDLINFDKLNPNDHIANLNNAFNVADDKLGIARLLDAEDVDVQRPDDRSIMTYIAAYYHYFAKMKSEVTGTKRIAKVLGGLLDMEHLQDDYETLVSGLLEWIHGKINALNDRHFDNSLEGIRKDMYKFTEYRVVEKPPKYRERGNIEVLFFNIQAKLKAGGRRLYIPPEGRLVRDIESGWIRLEKAEHDRELALREELIRQERLEQLAEKFERKAALRESWLNDMTAVLSDQNFGSNTTQVEAALKKHEAIAADIEARRDRFTALKDMVGELDQENYHGKEEVKKREQQIMAKWAHLMELLEKKRRILNGFNDMLEMFRQIESTSLELKDMEPTFRSEDTGKHLLGAEDLLHKHNLAEAQLTALGGRIRKLNHRAQPYMKSLVPEAQLLQKRLEPLNKDYENLHNLSQLRKAKLEESLAFFQFLQDSEEEEAWLVERIRLAKSQDVGKDLVSCMMLIKRHEALEQEMQARMPKAEQIYQVGDQLVKNNHYAKNDVKNRVNSLKDKWQRLRDLVKQRRTRLEDAAESHQYYVDANEAESWMREKMPLVCSEDFGKDEPTAKNLLQRHNRLDEEIKAFEQDIKRLDQLAMLMTKASPAHSLSPEKSSQALTIPGAGDDDNAVEEELVDVPYEYEVEEIREQEVVREEVVEKRVPQIKASFAYKGNGMEMEKGEILTLLQKTNADWWSARRENGQEGYVPANYAKEIEPKVVKKSVKHPVKQPVKVKVLKTGVRKELVKKPKSGTSLRRTPSARSQANLHFDRENLEQRQQGINNAYKQVCQLSQNRKLNLEDAIVFFKFCRECDNFESWMNDKEQIMQTKESLSENMEAIKRKYETLITDMAAHSYVIDDINKLADDMIQARHSKTDYVKKRKAEINDRWKRLNNIKMQREKSLAGASGIEVFQKICDELKGWIGEKINGINLDDVGKDLKSVQALQRRHQNLEQELKPLEEKLNKMRLIANDVRKSYPDEARHVNQREKEIVDMWNALQDKAKKHKKLLDDAEEQYRFREEAKDLDNWIGDMKGKLREKQVPHDVAEAEALLKKHNELKDDIASNKERFDRLNALAQNILAKDPNNKEVLEKLRQLKAEQDLIDELWRKKNKELEDAKKLQAFLREADQIDSVIASNDAFLDFKDVGNSVEDADALKKRHEDFEKSLRGQEERMKALDELADRLLREGHPDAKLIDEKRKQLRERLRGVQDKCDERKRQLEASQGLQEFKRDADELTDWIKEKYHMACDESYRDLSNLLPKLQKHQALEAELKTNKDRLDDINKTGTGMVKDGHFAGPEIKSTLKNLNSEWDRLDDKVKDKGTKLRQAAQQELFNKALEDANAKLAEMEKLVSSDDIGKDLRSVRDLLKNHQMLENEMAVNAENLKSIVEQGNKLARAGHFDSAGILKAVQDFDKRFTALQQPMARRRQKLEDSLKLHQFIFDADSELLWIKDHKPAVTSLDYGKNLIDAQNLHAKHKKLDVELQGHQPMIDRVLAGGNALVKSKHFATPAIQDKAAELSSTWSELLKQSGDRKKNLDVSLEKQKYLSEASDVQTWLNEKKHLVSSEDFGRDENGADNLLTKHKVLESEVKAYKDIIKNMGKEADRLQKLDPASAKEISSTQAGLEKQMSDLETRCGDRRRKLEGSKNFHEFMRESWDLEHWINDQMQMASSEDYGQDFEHLQFLLNKFSEFQLGIEAGSKRFERVDKLATQLVANKNPQSTVVLEKQDQLRNAWQNLLEHVDSRSQKLTGAGELHRFNRDVEDALSRIQEKYASIPEDLGRDLKAVQSYIKKHEGFENDLVALEAQLQVLIDDSTRLQEAYPGGNAEHIAHQQAIVVENWEILQEKAAQRKSDLQATMDLYWFLSAVKNLMNWADQVLSEMSNEEPARGVAAVADQQKYHNEMKAEIDAREDTFANVVESGRAMIKNGHFAADTIQDKVQELMEERDKLHGTWLSKRDRLNQVYDQQAFLRDAQQLELLSTSQEAYLQGTELGSTVPQVEALIKKHDAFENVLASQDAKLDALKDFGERLIKEHHFDTKNIKSVLDAIIKRRAHIKDLSEERKNKLADSLLYAQFNRDAAEAESWIEDKLKIVKEESFSNVRDLQDKMKHLKKHQAFESEILANADRIKTIKQTGETLLKKRHEATPEIQQRVNNLIAKWNELMKASNERGKGLEEARDILKFNEEVEKVEAWIREKETLVAACDLGRDYEHCLELQKKVNDVEAGVTVDENRVNDIKKLADKLISQGRTETRLIKDKRDSLVNKWQNIQGALEDHRKRLAIALEIHAFNRDLDDINDRINEKAAAMSSDDYGKDLAAIQGLQRKQEDVEKDMTAIHLQIQKMDAVYRQLCKKYPDMAAKSEKKLSDLKDNWERLEDLASARKLKLEDAYQLYRFLTSVKEHINWCNNLVTIMNAGDLANTVAEAEEQLQAHLERKTEMIGRYPHYQSLKERGEKFITQKHYASDEIRKNLVNLETVWNDVNDNWEKRKLILTQLYDLQVYEEYAEQADLWLVSKEAFLANEDLGNTLSSVDELIKKHDGFTTTLEAQAEKITTLEQLAQALLAQDHYASDLIKSRCNGVVGRMQKVKQAADQRRAKLIDSRNYQQFLGNVYEVVGWISEKMKVALDESYNDPSNLQGKIQKHQAFEAELMANRKRVDVVAAEGQNLISSNHYASKDIRDQLQNLESTWKDLVASSQEKKERLNEAYEALSFHRMSADADAWMDEVEGHLSSEDHGKDIVTVNNLLKKHQLLEEDIVKHEDKMKSLTEMAESFRARKHFMSSELCSRAKKIMDRYKTLNEPTQIRRDNLEDALLLYTYYRDVQDELSWIREKRPVAAMTELGDSLLTVQNLQKKHQALENEIVAHEPLIEAVVSMAHHMVNKKHPATKDVEARLEDLLNRLQELKNLSADRKLKLLDAVESQTFYSESAEAEIWMTEKKQQLKVKDFGKDEDSVQALLKKLDALELDIDNFHNNVGELAALSQGLITRGHFDSKNIQQQQVVTEDRFRELQDLVAQRRSKLQEAKKLYEFHREAYEVTTWIREKEAIAGSDDYGTDLEHVQILQQKFNDFIRDLMKSEERINHINTIAGSLTSAGHAESSAIKKRQDQINHLWAEVKELANARQNSLAGAKKVHAFVRDADDAIEWIEEKDIVVSSEDYGQDIESVKALLVKHEGFERDLAAISEQVENITKNARSLLQSFPDAQEHIQSKLVEMSSAWNSLLRRAQLRKDRLHQAESVQLYFNDYRGLCAWCNEMQARITTDELAKDVAGAEALVNRHKENKAEIDARTKELNRFIQKGNSLIAEKNFLSADIQDKIDHLNTLFENLVQTWQQRKVLYDQNLDLELLKRDMDQLDAWLNLRKPVLDNKATGDSIDAVEELLQKHDDFEKMVFAQEDRFNSINRITLLEHAFKNQKKQEEHIKVEEEKRREKERMEELKKREQERILEERRREEELRRAQEVRRRREAEDADTDEFSKHRALEPEVEVPSGVSAAAAEEQTSRSGLVPSDAWHDGGEMPTKKAARTESQKKEKRQRTLSLKTKKPAGLQEYKGPGSPVIAEIEGFLERKHELQKGRTKAPLRSWKTYYTVLVGQLMCFFKDERDYQDRFAAAPPIGIHGATCEIATDYTKKKNVLRLTFPDGAEYLFVVQDPAEMVQWQKKIQHIAAEDPSTLPPALQLAHYDADAHGQTPASPAHSGSGSRGPPSENGDASPTLAKKPIDARLSDLPVQSPASQKDDRYSSNTRATHKTGSTSSDNQGHVSRSYQEPASDVASSYPYQGSHEPDTGHYYTGGRKPSATEVPPLPASVPPPARMDSGDRRSSYASDAPSDGRYDDRHYTEEQGHGYKSQVSAQRASAAPASDSGSYSQHSGYQQEEVYPSRYSSQGQGGSYSEASTLPYGTAPPHASHPTQAATLDYGAKPPVAAKPEKKKHGFFGGVFNKGKKEKEKDAKK